MSFGISVRNGLAVGLLASTFLSSRSSRNIPASLILNFTDGIYRSSGRNYAFSNIITFSRTTNATLVDATGKLTYAPNNLVTNSEAFEDAAWTKTSSTIAANVAVAPNGTSTADKHIPNAGVIMGTGAAETRVFQSPTATLGVNYVFSIYAKAGEYDQIALAVITASPPIALFSLTLGTVVSGTGATITPVGNGWYRCAIVATASATGALALRWSAKSSTVSVGDGTSGIFVWGAQFEAVTYQTAPSAYNSTSPANLLGFTEEFDNAAWSKTRATITANATLAPNGTTTADKLNDDGVIVGRSYVSQSYTYTNTTHTLSFYAKAGEATSVNCYLVDSVGIVAASDATINLTNGQVTVGSAVVTDVGNGWYRIAVSGVPTASAGSVRILLGVDTATTNGIFLWGAQLSNSASVDPYIYNPAAALTSIAYYGPRFDYNPVTLAANGLLIEEQRVNSLLYSDQFDNAGWTKAGSTITANATTSPDGTANADKLVENTAAASQHRVQQAVTTVIGTSYTHTIYLKAGERTLVTLRVTGTATFAGCTVNLATGTISAVTGVGTITNAGGGWYRVSVTGTADSTTTTCFVNLSDGSITYTGDGVSGAFLYGAQLEAGSFATSYIPTVASTVTRAADVASMLGSNFSSWYNQSEGTLFAQALTFNSGTGKYPWSVHNGTGTELIAPYFLNANGGGFVVDGTTQAQIETAGLATLSNIALAVKLNDFALSINGNPVGTDNAGTMPTPDQMQIGNRADGARTLNGHIRRITYYPSRLTNAQLQALTA